MAANASNAILNVPNVLTTARFVLAIVVFVLIPLQQYLAAVAVFIVAAGTDWLDGWWARKYGQITKLGRIFDPFVDKIIICGTFTFLAAEPASEIAPWMAVVVMGREMLVTALRGVIEQQGGDFSAKMSGKLKMVFQCIAAVLSLLHLHNEHSSHPLLTGTIGELVQWLILSDLRGPAFIFVWLAIIATVWSGLEYIVAAARILGRGQ